MPAGTPSGRRDPQIKAAKVKIEYNAKGEPRKRLPKRPIEKLDGDTLQRQSTIYLRERNKAMRMRTMREAIALGRERETLIERGLVIKQLSYLVIVFRQKLLTLPQLLGARLRVRFPDLAREGAAVATEVVHELLTELGKWPLEAVDPHWLEKVEEEEAAGELSDDHPDRDPGQVD